MRSTFYRPLALTALLLLGLPGRYGWLATAKGQAPAAPANSAVYTYVE